MCRTVLLTDKQYETDIFKDIYHSRWGVEELYKISKEFIIVDDFHGKSERGVKQELFAHFVLITMNRLCSNKAEDQISKMLSPLSKKDEIIPKIRRNRYGLMDIFRSFSLHILQRLILIFCA